MYINNNGTRVVISLGCEGFCSLQNFPKPSAIVLCQCFQSLWPKIVEELTLRKAQFCGVANIGQGTTGVSPR